MAEEKKERKVWACPFGKEGDECGEWCELYIPEEQRCSLKKLALELTYGPSELNRNLLMIGDSISGIAMRIGDK